MKNKSIYFITVLIIIVQFHQVVGGTYYLPISFYIEGSISNMKISTCEKMGQCYQIGKPQNITENATLWFEILIKKSDSQNIMNWKYPPDIKHNKLWVEVYFQFNINGTWVTLFGPFNSTLGWKIGDKIDTTINRTGWEYGYSYDIDLQMRNFTNYFKEINHPVNRNLNIILLPILITISIITSSYILYQKYYCSLNNRRK